MGSRIATRLRQSIRAARRAGTRMSRPTCRSRRRKARLVELREKRFFRPAGGWGLVLPSTHALRRGLHSFAASRLQTGGGTSEAVPFPKSGANQNFSAGCGVATFASQPLSVASPSPLRRLDSRGGCALHGLVQEFMFTREIGLGVVDPALGGAGLLLQNFVSGAALGFGFRIVLVEKKGAAQANARDSHV